MKKLEFTLKLSGSHDPTRVCDTIVQWSNLLRISPSWQCSGGSSSSSGGGRFNSDKTSEPPRHAWRTRCMIWGMRIVKDTVRVSPVAHVFGIRDVESARVGQFSPVSSSVSPSHAMLEDWWRCWGVKLEEEWLAELPWHRVSPTWWILDQDVVIGNHRARRKRLSISFWTFISLSNEYLKPWDRDISMRKSCSGHRIHKKKDELCRCMWSKHGSFCDAKFQVSKRQEEKERGAQNLESSQNRTWGSFTCAYLIHQPAYLHIHQPSFLLL